MQVGKSEGSKDSQAARTQLGRPAHMVLYGAANELYVAEATWSRRTNCQTA